MNAPENVAAIFFDCGSTLIDPNPPIDEVFLEVARRRGHTLTLGDIAPHMQAVYRFYDMEYLKDGDFWCSPTDSVEIWRDMYRFLCHLTGLTDDVDGMSENMFAEYLKPSRWFVYDDVRPCLRAIKERGLKTAVVSNWDPSLSSTLRALGLLPYFDEVLASAEIGYRKPGSAIFQIAAERLGVDLSACVHVGDKVEADGDGARDAGAHPVIIDRADALTACDYDRVTALSTLFDMVEM